MKARDLLELFVSGEIYYESDDCSVGLYNEVSNYIGIAKDIINRYLEDKK